MRRRDGLDLRRLAPVDLHADLPWTGRFVDNILDPRSGQVLNLQLGGASQALLSDRNFMRAYGRYQLFVPVQRRLAASDALNTWATHVGSAAFAVPPGAAPGEWVGQRVLA